MEIFKELLGFDWDKGNEDKNFVKHRVTKEECEEGFFDPHKKILRRVLYVGEEARYLVIGYTKKDRLLFVAFTARGGKLRVISARDLARKERKLYEEAEGL